MPTPNASYSVSLTVELDHRPGTLGRLTTAIGDAGGNITAVDIVEADHQRIVRDVTVLATDDVHVRRSVDRSKSSTASTSGRGRTGRS